MCIVACRDHLVCLGQAHGRRLLREDMLACPGCLNHDLPVQMIRCRDTDNMDVFVFEHLLKGRVCPDSELRRHLGSPVPGDIKDTDRLSMHSFGIAIDLAPATTQYWKDEASSETAKIGYKNTMPLSIVRIFEKHGFIWGGRWYHYDTMHFEYRPELLAPSCSAASR